MIATENIAVNDVTFDADFTVEHYRVLLGLAKSNWGFVKYDNIPWGERFVLWRHDVDYSLNRSLELARIEHQEGVSATYFVNPHSEFYNLAESGQYQIIKQILSLGHDLGMHFDAAFHGVMSEAELNCLVARDARNLEELFGAKLVAFSFHNPIAAHLTCEAEQYGGLINCYSRRFKSEVAYCSDSNGYWRFRRLYDVLEAVTDPCLQVLTHPGWWQDKPMPPRQRVFRGAYGRAAATMRLYDSGLQEHGRLNHAGAADSLRFIEDSQPQLFELCDYLWNQGAFQTLFVELWRLHEVQINRLCKMHLGKEWRIPVGEVNAFFRDGLLADGWKLFDALFNSQWTQEVGVVEAEYKVWLHVRNQLICGRVPVDIAELEAGCAYLCQLTERLAAWGLHQSFAYDGLALESMETGFESVKLQVPKPLQLRWDELKARFASPSEQVKNGTQN